MKKTIFLLYVVSITISCKSNFSKIGDVKSNYIPYYLKVYKADSLYLTKNYQQSYEILDSLFKKYEPINIPLYFEYENYIKMAVINNKNKKKDIIKLIKKYDYRLDDFENDSILKLALKRNSITKEKVIKLHAKFENNIDTIYRNIIHKMNNDDQFVRNLQPINLADVKKVDFKNDSILNILINSKGFPLITTVGSWKKINNEIEYKSVSLDVLLIHFSSNKEWFEKSEKKYFQYVKQGLLYPFVYAYMFDKNYNAINSGGSYFKYLFSNVLFEENQQNFKEINEIRKKVGLPTVEFQKFHYKKRILKQ